MDSVTGSKLWIPVMNDKVFDTATVLAFKEDGQISVRMNSKPNRLMVLPDDGDLPLVDEVAEKAAAEYHDLVRLDPPHIANVLHLLRIRSTEEELPYTFVGPVLVSVNPLMSLVKDENGKLVPGEACEDKDIPHPYRISETVMQQLRYAKITGQPSNQAVIISGESGAGKTEAAKRVLQRLVQYASLQDSDKKISKKSSKKSSSKASRLDKRLIDTNPILESLGNAVTLRNRNSSRFGKFMKLHLPNGQPTSHIDRASIDTYLLERSRVSGFLTGECNYHVFYQMIAGCDSSMLKKLDMINENGKCEPEDFNYLRPKSNSSPSSNKPKKSSSQQQNVFKTLRTKKRDEENYKELVKALESVGLGAKDQLLMFQVLAAVLHIGNVPLEGAHGSDSDPATIPQDNATSLKATAKLLGVKSKDLQKVLCEKEVNAGGETMYAKVSAQDARRARDAIAKQLYSHLFDWVVCSVNADLSEPKTVDEDSSASKSTKQLNRLTQKSGATIGVLDIFGFETFLYNDLEQLLINYTNETLHGVFLRKIFDSELSLYFAEGLLTEEDDMISVPVNQDTVELLAGIPEKRQLGVLDIIIQQGQNPGASDEKMNKQLHNVFERNPNFPKPHLKDIAHIFKISHFAGIVSYHVGNFLSKNHDRLPDSVQTLFSNSEIEMVQEMWAPQPDLMDSGNGTLARAGSGTSRPRLQSTLSNASSSSSPSRRAKRSSSSIVSKFKRQIQVLCDDLELSQCSFIRCVKPNFFMERSIDSKGWFEPQYVHSQLKNLGIEPTVQVLSQGLPNRIPYRDFFQAYSSKLSSKHIKTWEKLGGGHRSFIAALFWAFGIPPSQYKLGFTKVFFKTGDLQQLERVLDTTNADIKKVGKRFRRYLVITKWRHCIAVAHSARMWLELLNQVREQHEQHQRLVEEHLFRCIVSIQAVMRGFVARRRYREKIAAIVAAKERKLQKQREKALQKEKEKEQKRLELLRAKEAADKTAFAAKNKGQALELMQDTMKDISISKSKLKSAKSKKDLADMMAKEIEDTELGIRKSIAMLDSMENSPEGTLASFSSISMSSASSSGRRGGKHAKSKKNKSHEQLDDASDSNSNIEESDTEYGSETDGSSSSHVSYRSIAPSTDSGTQIDENDVAEDPVVPKSTIRKRPVHSRAPSAPAWLQNEFIKSSQGRRPVSLGARGLTASRTNVKALREDLSRKRVEARQKQVEIQKLVQQAEEDERISQESARRVDSGRKRLERLSMGKEGGELIAAALAKQGELVEVELDAGEEARKIAEVEHELQAAKQSLQRRDSYRVENRLSVGRKAAQQMRESRLRRDSPYMLRDGSRLGPQGSSQRSAFGVHAPGEESDADEDEEHWIRKVGHARGNTVFVPSSSISTPCYFTAKKRAIHSRLNWKKRYFVLSKSAHTLRYYSKKSNSLVGGRGAKGELQLSATTMVAYVPHIGRRKHIVRVTEPRARSGGRRNEKQKKKKKRKSKRNNSNIEDSGTTLLLSLGSAEEAKRVYNELQLAVKYIRGDVTVLSNMSQNGRGTRYGGNVSEMQFDDARARYREGLFKLLTHKIINESELQQMLDNSETPLDLSLLTFSDAPEDLTNSIQLQCEDCNQTNNTYFGPYCRRCEKILPISLEALI